MLVRDFLPVHLAEYMTSLTGTSASNIAIKRMVVRDIFSTAHDNGITPVNAAAKLPRVSGTYEGHKALDRSEIDLVSRNYRHHRAGIAVMLMMWAGLRRGEALALRWEDVDLASGIITVTRSLDVKRGIFKDTKTKAGQRTVPIFFPLMRALKDERQESGLICCTASDEPYTESAINSAMNSFTIIMEKIVNGLPNPQSSQGYRRTVAMQHKQEAGEAWRCFSFTPHDLRVTFATMCYDAGVDVYTVKEWMGHESIETTMGIYTKLSKERKTTSTDAMDLFSKDYAKGPADLLVITKN